MTTKKPDEAPIAGPDIDLRDHAEAVVDAWATFIEFHASSGLHPDTLLSELGAPQAYFLDKVTVREMAALIALVRLACWRGDV